MILDNLLFLESRVCPETLLKVADEIDLRAEKGGFKAPFKSKRSRSVVLTILNSPGVREDLARLSSSELRLIAACLRGYARLVGKVGVLEWLGFGQIGPQDASRN
jgi:hypothetical protein